MVTNAEQIARNAIERLNARDYVGWQALLAPDFRMVYPAAFAGDMLELSFSAEEVLKTQTEIDDAFPDLDRRVTHVMSTENEVALFIELEATHMGRYKSMNATNKRIYEVLVARHEFEGGRIKRCIVYRSPHHARGELGLLDGFSNPEPPNTE